MQNATAVALDRRRTLLAEPVPRRLEERVEGRNIVKTATLTAAAAAAATGAATSAAGATTCIAAAVMVSQQPSSHGEPVQKLAHGHEGIWAVPAGRMVEEDALAAAVPTKKQYQ